MCVIIDVGLSNNNNIAKVIKDNDKYPITISFCTLSEPDSRLLSLMKHYSYEGVVTRNSNLKQLRCVSFNTNEETVIILHSCFVSYTFSVFRQLCYSISAGTQLKTYR